MYVFETNNTDEMAREVYGAFKTDGVERGSRNGRVLVLPKPVTMVYNEPLRRCNFTIGRKANHVFHHMEAMWMLAGRNDVSFLEMFNSNMKNYSDDGYTFNAAYGYRIQYEFGHDQLLTCIRTLAHDPNSRQAVCHIWDHKDLDKNTKDKACNMSMVFSINLNGAVDLIVFNRSNDAVFGGVTGTNPVHFSYFLQYVAEKVGRPVGILRFVSNNLHVYLDLYDYWHQMDWETIVDQPESKHYGLGSIEEIKHFCRMAVTKGYLLNHWDSPTLSNVTVPMYNYWVAKKFRKDELSASHWLGQMNAPDWSAAIALWESKYELA